MDQPFTQIVAWNESLLDEDQLINVLVFFPRFIRYTKFFNFTLQTQKNPERVKTRYILANIPVSSD